MSPVRPRPVLVIAALVAASAGLIPAGGSASGSSLPPEPTTAPNQPPDGVDDAYEVLQDESLNVAALVGVLANDSDPDGDPIEVTGSSQPANGSVSMSPLGSFAYTPELGFTGIDSFRYEVSDDQGNSTGVVVEVVITVTPASPPTSTDPPNGPPLGVDDVFEVVEGATLDVDVPGLLANDTDPDGDPIRVSLVSEPAHGDSAVFQVGSFQYTPDPGFTGLDSFLYEVSDDQANSTGLIVHVTITVTAAAPEPTADDGTPTTALETADPGPEEVPSTTTVPVSTEPGGTSSTVAADPAGTTPEGTDEAAADVGAGVGTAVPSVTTTTPSGALPATGVEPNVLGLGALLVVAGSFVIALGSIATHGARRAGRGHRARRR